ncbi:MAG: hypothetical protein AAF328_07280 [Planctomycetota bacterium]
MSPAEITRAIAQARDALANVSALRSPVRVELREASGKTTRLDGAIAIRDPGDVRLKLWRHGRDVMDLTRRDGRVHAWIDPRLNGREHDGDTAVNQARTAQPIDDAQTNRLSDWLRALAWFVTPDEPKDPPWLPGSDAYFVEALNGNEVLTYDVASGLVVKRRPAQGQAWRAEFAYAFEKSEQGDVPRRIELQLTSDETKVRIKLLDPVWNETLGDALFVAPPRAKALSQGGAH